MKKNMMMALLLTAGVAFAAQSESPKMSLAEARGQIDQVIKSPEKMSSVIKQLSPGDQKTFLADVNKAIGDMPGSAEEKTAASLNVNSAAIRATTPENRVALLAETFATASPEALTVINESFANTLFSRTADPAAQISDEQFMKIATEAVQAVQERCEETDNGSVRTAFAITMFVRVSNGSPANAMDQLVDTMTHDDAKELARSEWIPAAIGDGRTQSYDSMLASADAGLRPDAQQVLVISGPQYETALLADLSGKNTDLNNMVDTHTPVLDAAQNVLVHQAPNAGNDKLGQDGAAGGAVNGAVIEAGALPGESGTNTRPTPQDPDPLPKDPEHPDPYWFQSQH